MLKKILMGGILVAFVFPLFPDTPLIQEGYIQLGPRFLSSTYTFRNTDDDRPEQMRVLSHGAGVRTMLGDDLQGVLDVAVVLPFKAQTKTLSAVNFSDIKIGGGTRFGLDTFIGVGYRFDLYSMSVIFSTGFHVGMLLMNNKSLVSFGISLDGQIVAVLGESFTVNVGVKYNQDFFGSQTFYAGKTTFEGLPGGFSVYTGVGLKLKRKQR